MTAVRTGVETEHQILGKRHKGQCEANTQPTNLLQITPERVPMQGEAFDWGSLAFQRGGSVEEWDGLWGLLWFWQAVHCH